MSDKAHWEEVYLTKAPEAMSWYAPHLNTSLNFIGRAATDLSAAIIDVGGGESTLVDDLITAGYQNLSVLDLSTKAIAVAKKRLGAAADKVSWYEADVTTASFPAQQFDIWHDRAVFHFLTDPQERSAYVAQVLSSVKVGGYVILATFGPAGPEKCSGLPVMRYDPQALYAQFGQPFALISNKIENHQTPSGITQQFLYCLCQVKATAG